MSTARLTDLASFLGSCGDICLAGAFIGCIFTMVQAAFVLAFRGENGRTGSAPPITVLKPLHGLEPGLPTRLQALQRQDYRGEVQVLCGAQDHASPVVAVVRDAEDVLDGPPIELVVDPRSHGANRKVSNLINMMPRARHDILVLADADIEVGPDYLSSITAILGGPRVGAVTCLYHGIGDGAVWTRLSALAINSHFLPQAITAIRLGLAKPCFGATIAMRRSMLDRIGGFNAFADVLADDYAIGEAVRSAGYEVKTAPFLVGHRCFESSMRQLLLQQLRVARTIKGVDPLGYWGTIVTHPWPLALLGLLSGSNAALLLLVAVLAARVTLCRCVERRFGLARHNYWLIPLHDIVAFGIYVSSFFGATVYWRGAEFRVSADGTLIEDKT